MGAAPLSWLAKIGGDTLKTKAKLLSSAINELYDDGQCKIVAVVDNTADNGKTVLITTDDNKTYSGTIANKKCEFLLPPKTLYTVQKVSSGSAEFTTKVEAGYGDYILVHLDTGYVEVKQGDIVGLDYIKAATADALKNKVPEANAVKELNSNLNVRYNSDNDTIDVLINGEWKRCLKAGMIAFDLTQLNYTNGPYFFHTNGTNIWEAGDGVSSETYYNGSCISEAFDCTIYNSIDVDVDYWRSGGNDSDVTITVYLVDGSNNVLKQIANLYTESSVAKNMKLSIDISSINTNVKIKMTSKTWSWRSIKAVFNKFEAKK